MFSRDAKNPVFIGFFNFLFFACLEDVECEIVLFQGFSTFSTGFSTVLHIQNESYKMFKQGFPQKNGKTLKTTAFFKWIKMGCQKAVVVFHTVVLFENLSLQGF